MATRYEEPTADQEVEQDTPRGSYNDYHDWARRRRERDKKGAQDWARKKAKEKVQGQVKKQLVRQGVRMAARAAVMNPWVLIAIIGIIVFLLIIFFFFFKKMPQTGTQDAQPTPTVVPSTGGGSTGQRTEIPGFTLTLEAPESINNGELIRYTVNITHDASSPVPIDTITVYNNIPNNTTFDSATGNHQHNTDTKIISWPLSDTTNRSSFTFTLRPTEPDSIVRNRVYATTTYMSTPAEGGGAGTGTCTAGASWCSVESLRPYFGAAAEAASVVCNGESGGNPGALNPNCDTNDYSVGLFQINLVAHCPGAYGGGRWGTQSCDNLLSVERRNQCEALWRGNPVENIKKAVEIYNSAGWAAWGAARACGIR